MNGEKGISDPVHGTIQLTKLEARLVGSPQFQRLRGIKQLGLAYMVFPGADYSRFSHSLGVCHVTQKLISALRDSGVKISEEEATHYRLAGLLHDIGHYPFSHAMEDAVGDFYAAQFIEPTSSVAESSGDIGSIPDEAPLDHEAVGKELIRSAPEIAGHLKSAGISPESVYKIFTREEPPRFSNLVSSDLDADRIDYLLRTAHHTGLPYGHVDLPYLLTQLTVDSSEQICLRPKALRTADHFLLGRYFDYQSVAFHKTVVALELVLKDVLTALLSADRLDMSATAVKLMIESGEWLGYDDASMLRQMRDLARITDDKILRMKIESILYRRPPKMVYQYESLELRDNSSDDNHKMRVKLLRKALQSCAEKFDIPRELWYDWNFNTALTAIGSSVPYGEEIDQDKVEQSIRILEDPDAIATPIGNVKNSLMRVLSNHRLYSLRAFVILPPGQEKKRSEIEAFLEEEAAA